MDRDDYLAQRARPLEAKTVTAHGRTWQVEAGICPCDDCGHNGQIMWYCDPDADPTKAGCRCCRDVCS